MADFKKILDHPERDKIVAKLTGGMDTPKDVARYLKTKYDKPDEAHLRLPATLLEEFVKTYGDHYGFIERVKSDEISGKLDKKIAQSLLDNKEWRERLAEVADEEIDLKKKLLNLVHIIEARAEQVFDKIQENPGSTKADYVMAKYFELIGVTLEKADKILNDRPDVRVEHTYTMNMVNQQTAAIQEAIGRAAQEIGPEFASRFIELVDDEMRKLKPVDGEVIATTKDLQRESQSVDKLIGKSEELDGELEDDDDDS